MVFGFLPDIFRISSYQWQIKVSWWGCWRCSGSGRGRGPLSLDFFLIFLNFFLIFLGFLPTNGRLRYHGGGVGGVLDLAGGG